MKLQSHQHTCGAVALCNAVEALGVRSLSEVEAIEMAESDPVEGTEAAGIKKALKKLDLNGTVIKTKDAAIAYWALVGALEHGNPALLVVDNDSHWVAAIGILGSRVLVADSADAGVVVVTPAAKLMERWACPAFYGLIVGTKG